MGNSSPKAGRSNNIVFVAWKEEYSVGDSYLDYQHRSMLKTINDLYMAIRGGSSSEIVAETLTAVDKYIHRHLEHEEAVLLDCNYPNRETHIAIHDEMRHWLEGLQAQYRAGQRGLSQEMIVYLKNWWVNHITKVDSQYRKYLK